MRNGMAKDGTSTLVIDVRGAGGVDLGMAEQVFALIAQRPYRVIQNMMVRSAQAPGSYKYAAPADEFYAAVGGRYLPDLNGTMTLRPDDPRLEPVKNDPRAFADKVYVVCDGLTREAGAAFVMLAKRSGRARVVGEETGSNALSFCGGHELLITLPRTGCMLHVPLTRFVPDGLVSGPVDRGELPHHVVTQRPWGLAKGRDTVREALLEVIRELR
ncbi:MAG: S41 family peptidase [Flavobacteriales bacterium]